MWLQWKLERGRGGAFSPLKQRCFQFQMEPDPDRARRPRARGSSAAAAHSPRPTVHRSHPHWRSGSSTQAQWGGRIKSFLEMEAPSWSHDRYIKAEPRWLLLVFSRRMFPETSRWNIQQKWRFLPACLSWWSYKQTGSSCAWPRTSSWQPGSRSYPATEDTRSIYYPGPL